MLIDTIHFTPWHSLLGGLLIGLAATGFILFNGKIAGISGIVGGLLSKPATDISERFCFVGGIIVAPIVYSLFTPLPEITIDTDLWLVAIAGLIVGLATRLGSGCTSGHGVCGLARLSARSLVATLAFMATGFITVALIRHVL